MATPGEGGAAKRAALRGCSAEEPAQASQAGTRAGYHEGPPNEGEGESEGCPREGEGLVPPREGEGEGEGGGRGGEGEGLGEGLS